MIHKVKGVIFTESGFMCHQKFKFCVTQIWWYQFLHPQAIIFDIVDMLYKQYNWEVAGRAYLLKEKWGNSKGSTEACTCFVLRPFVNIYRGKLYRFYSLYKRRCILSWTLSASLLLEISATSQNKIKKSHKNAFDWVDFINYI